MMVKFSDHGCPQTAVFLSIYVLQRDPGLEVALACGGGALGAFPCMSHLLSVTQSTWQCTTPG